MRDWVLDIPSVPDAGGKGFVKAVWVNKWGFVPAIESSQLAGNAGGGGIDWLSIPAISDFRTLGSGLATAADTHIRIAYNRDYLYIKVNAGLSQDDQGTQTDRLEQIDLLLSPNANGDEYVQIPIRFSNRSSEEEAGLQLVANWDTNGPIKWRKPLLDGQYQLGIAQKDHSWEALVAISLDAFGSSRIKSGTEWRFNAIRYREGDAPVSSWVPLFQSYYMDNAINTKPNELRSYVVGFCAAGQGRMGSLFFDKLPVGDAVLVQGWEPANIKLRYIDYAEKELSFDRDTSTEASVTNACHAAAAWLHIRWRHPSGDTAEVEVSQLKLEGGRWIARFNSSPPTEAGMVQLHLRFQPQGEHGLAYCGIAAFDVEALIAAGNEQFHSVEQADEVLNWMRQPNSTAIVPPSLAPASAEVQRIMAIIPDQAGFLFTGVPHDPLTRTDGVYTFDPEHPQQLVSVKDGMVYPNGQYAEDRAIVVRNRNGQEVVYPYHEGDDGKRYFITAHLWYEQKRYAMVATKEIALTDPLGAARLLYRWVQKVDQYVPVNDYIWRNYPVHASQTPPYPYWGGIMARWFCLELYELTPLIEAYAAVRVTKAFEVLSREVGEDVERRIVNDLLLRELEFVTSYVVVNGNLDYLIWLGYIRLGKALREPDLIHRAVGLMKRFYESQFLADGFWNEVSLSYHEQSVQGFRQAVKELEGWSDPAGYVSPRDGLRFERLDVLNVFPGIADSLSLGSLLTFPNGKYVPLNDTWASDENVQQSHDERSMLLPSAGVAKLSVGSGAGQMQLILNFSPKYGHHHADPLGLIMYAKGQELLPDIGYTYTRHRLLYVSTFAHNTVVVDGKDMTCNSGLSRHGGNVSLFAPVETVFQVVQARQETAYPNTTNEYSRELWWIGFDGEHDGEGYTVDLFRVCGGSRHEYTLNGAANLDAVIQTSLPFIDYGPYLVPPGTEVIQPATEYDKGQAGGEYYGYIYLQDVRRADVGDGAYELTMVTEDGTTESPKLRINGFVEPGRNELFIGRSSSLRATRTGGVRNKRADINDQLTQYYLPKIVLRREDLHLRSTFVTVMEPYIGNTPHIQHLERLQVEPHHPGSAAVSIRYGNVTDFVISSNDPDIPLTVGDIVLQGRLGFIRVREGKVCQMRLLGGILLKKGEETISGSGSSLGTILTTTRKASGDAQNGFVTDTPVPSSKVGLYIIVTHPDGQSCGHEIRDIIARETGSMLVTEFDPGFEISPDGASAQKTYPHLSWLGEHRYRIDNIEYWHI